MTKVYLLCYRLHLELGGLPRILLNKANILSKKGYKVKILTIEPNNNYKFIEMELKKRNQLYSSVEMINIFNFYEAKNNRNFPKLLTKLLNYLKLFNLKKIGYPLREHKNVSKIKYYTADGFCYLIELFLKNKKIAIFYIDRSSGQIYKFQDDIEFQNYFYTEICTKNGKKPILICEGSGPTPSISNLNQEIAYKISQLHSNPYTGPYSFGGPLREIGVLINMENNDAFITLTEMQKNDIIKQFGDQGNIFSIPNFVPKKGKISVKKNYHQIGIFTRISPEKNLEDAIRAFKIVVDKRNDAKLEIFGRATLPEECMELKKLEKLINELDLCDNVFLRGYIKDVDVEMAKSLATLITSKFEGFPMALLESMINSTPVISYDLHYGPRDVIDHQINGFLVEYNNVKQMARYIINILDDAEMAIKMGEMARKKILECFTDEIVTPQWEELFKKIRSIR